MSPVAEAIILVLRRTGNITKMGLTAHLDAAGAIPKFNPRWEIGGPEERARYWAVDSAIAELVSSGDVGLCGKGKLFLAVVYG